MVTGISRSGSPIAGFFLVSLVMCQAGVQAAPPVDPAAAISHPNSSNSTQPTQANAADTRKQEILRQVPRYAPDRVLVRFRPGTAASEIGKAHHQAGGKKLREIPGIVSNGTNGKIISI